MEIFLLTEYASRARPVSFTLSPTHFIYIDGNLMMFLNRKSVWSEAIQTANRPTTIDKGKRFLNNNFVLFFRSYIFQCVSVLSWLVFTTHTHTHTWTRPYTRPHTLPIFFFYFVSRPVIYFTGGTVDLFFFSTEIAVYDLLLSFFIYLCRPGVFRANVCFH